MSDEIESPTARIPSPREFLRSRRPERFSDSVRIAKRQLDRLELEYHLDTITNRGEETIFEHFARLLAEQEICPNLLPHTGPSGGGDSKVDSETIPVAESLSLSWYGGFAREAATERWAFAFSAKKDWQEKLKSDVKKIAETERGYTKAFFVTSQYVPDKKRAALEDQLRAKYGLDVRILDRTWILDSVFGNERQSMAIDALGLPESLRPELQRGPLDTEREVRLAELDRAIQEALRQGRRDSQLAADAIESATTARALDRPRVEVDGRFLRARELAQKAGSRHEVLDAVYEWAWTTFWWFEDFAKFPQLVREAFEAAGDTDNSYHLELLTNLFMCLRTAVEGMSADATAVFDEIGDRLRRSLQRVAEESGRPSNALHAATLLLQVRLITEPTEAAGLLRELRYTVEKARYLVGFPFATIAELIREMGPVFGDTTEYDALFDVVVAISGERSGDVTAARFLLDRGTQRLVDDDHLGAIRMIGRALGKLYKAETVSELVRALYLAGAAYAQAGLLWAARGATVTAASLATGTFHTYGTVTPKQVACYRRMAWLELELGRLPQALEWYDLAVACYQALHPSEDVGEGVSGMYPFDAVLGIHFLKTELTALRTLQRLPDALDQRGLFAARSALLFALGQPHEMPGDVLLEKEGDSKESFFRRWRDQPASAAVRTLALGTGATATIESRVLGCQITVEHDPLPPGTELAESILAGFEALAATGLTARWLAHEPLLRVVVKVTEFGAYPFSFRHTETLGRPVFHVACRPFAPGSLSHEDQSLLKQELRDLIVAMFAHVIVPPDEKTLEILIGEDLALQRAVDFTGSFVTTGNVLGPRPKLGIDEFFAGMANVYDLRRSIEWDAADRERPIEGTKKDLGLAPEPPGKGDVPRLSSHAQVQTLSLIRVPLWNRAGWKGVLFITPASGTENEPGMYLGFTDRDAAAAIFEGFLEDVGKEDVGDKLRVAVIRGISAKNPAWYRMIIGQGTAARELLNGAQAMALMVSRIHTMTPDSAENLERFLASYAGAGEYYLSPAILDANNGVDAVSRQRIAKRHLHIRQAWEIGPNDPDIVGIDEDDDLVIPPNIGDPPGLRAQARVRGMQQRR